MNIKVILGLRQYKSALILLLTFKRKLVLWDWWSRLLYRFPLTNFLYHFAFYYKSEIFITRSSIAVKGAVNISGKVILGE